MIQDVFYRMNGEDRARAREQFKNGYEEEMSETRRLRKKKENLIASLDALIEEHETKAQEYLSVIDQLNHSISKSEYEEIIADEDLPFLDQVDEEPPIDIVEIMELDCDIADDKKYPIIVTADKGKVSGFEWNLGGPAF